MQVQDPFRASNASRVQSPFTASQHPIQFSTVRPPQYPIQYANLGHYSIHPPPIPPRNIQTGTSFHNLPPILYPQYQQPLYPQGQSYLHPKFIAQPITVVRRPQGEAIPQVDQSQVKKLCEVPMAENTIFCVVCGSDYKTSQKEQHIKKHTRKGHERKLNQEALHKLQEFHKRQPKSNYLVKPIVEPEQVDVNFDPMVFQVIQEIIYEDESNMSKKQAATGQQGNNSFNYFDNNASLSHNQPNVHPAFDSQPNPFFNKQQQHSYHVPDFQPPHNSSVHVYGNTLNVYNEGLLKLMEQAQVREKTAQSGVKVRQSQPHPVNVPVTDARISDRIPNVPDVPLVYQSQNSHKDKTSSLLNQNKPSVSSQRYDSNEFKGFPQEQLQKIQIDPIEPQQSFSGARPLNEQSKRSTENNISQFIRELNAEAEPVERSLKKIPYQSEW